jgi:hypothetical protein
MIFIFTGKINVKEYLLSLKALYTPIDNYDIKNWEVVSLDISCNRNCISYVTCPKVGGAHETVRPGSNQHTFLSIQTFTEMNTPKVAVQQDCHYSLDITDHVKPLGRRHCKFLSVSPDGKYVALSFFERNTDNCGRIRNNLNPTVWYLRWTRIESKMIV